MPSQIHLHKKAHHTDQAPQAIGPYSQAIEAGGFLFISGQLGIDPLSSTLISTEIDGQIPQVFKNLQEVLKTKELDFNHLVKLTIYLRHMTDFPKVNQWMAENFQTPYPARATVEVSGLPMNAQIEIEAIAIINNK